MFPNKFDNPATKKPAAVATSSTSAGSSKSSLESKLNSRQLQFIRDARKRGCPITIEEYANQLRLTGELRDE